MAFMQQKSKACATFYNSLKNKRMRCISP